MAEGDSLGRLAAEIVACRLCPRLVEHRERVAREKRAQYREWEYWGRPVPGFGDPAARLILLGLAPAAHGGNRTGRVFTGDPSAQYLISALYELGLASQPTSEHREDGLRLYGTYITASVRCAPPENRPIGEETRTCAPYFWRELRLLSEARAVLALGGVAFHAYLRAVQELTGERARVRFGHGAEHDPGHGLPWLFGSYHPSPHNTYTGRLNRGQFLEVLRRTRDHAGLPEAASRS